MKKIIRNMVLPAVASSFILLSSAQAQTVIVDNTAQPVFSSDFIDTANWLANSFTMDATSRSLQSVTLSLDSALFVTGGTFQVQLWNDGGSKPGASIAALTGNSDPQTAGSYSYTPLSSVTLNAGTKYWVVATATTASGVYRWNSTTSSSSTGVGNLGGSGATGDSGSSWTPEDSSVRYILNVTAAAVPEPSSYAVVFGVLALGFAAARRWRHS